MPPELAHAPIEITHLGSAIWSYKRLMIGPIFCATRPDTIIRSACRGEARKTSEPKRAMSYVEFVALIISIAQQASPMVSGQTDELCAQRLTSSSFPRR